MLAKVSAESRVLIIGSKLSATDAAILLCREGHRVTMVSPSGNILAVRGRFRNEKFSFNPERMKSILARWDPKTQAPCPAWLRYAYLKYAARTLSECSHKPLRAQFSYTTRYDERLREEIAIAEQGDCLWQDLVTSFVHAANSMYMRDKEYLKFGFHPHFLEILYRYLTAIALPNARKLMRYIESGALALKRGELSDVVAAGSGDGGWLIDWGEGAQPFDAVVAATGFHYPYFVFNETGELEINTEGCRPEHAINISPDMAADHPRLAGRESIWFVGTPAHVRLFTPSALFIVVSLADQVVTNMMVLSGRDTARDDKGHHERLVQTSGSKRVNFSMALGQ